jgi:hypothetical protein
MATNDSKRTDPYAAGVDVQGEVLNPGFYPVSGLGAIEAIFQSGGLTDNAAYQDVTVEKGGHGRQLDLWEYIQNIDRPDIYVSPDYTVTVPRSEQSSPVIDALNKQIALYISHRKEQLDPQYNTELLKLSLSHNRESWAKTAFERMLALMRK